MTEGELHKLWAKWYVLLEAEYSGTSLMKELKRDFRMLEEMKAEFPTYEKVAAFREEHFLIDHSMDSLFLSILLEWDWKWLHVNIYTFDKRPIKPEIAKWFGEKEAKE